MEENTFDKIVSNTWDRLVGVLKYTPKTQAEMAKEIGISLTPYIRFIHKQNMPTFKTISKIEMYIAKREKEIKDEQDAR